MMQFDEEIKRNHAVHYSRKRDSLAFTNYTRFYPYVHTTYGLGAICCIGRSYTGAMVLQNHKAGLHAVLV